MAKKKKEEVTEKVTKNEPKAKDTKGDVINVKRGNVLIINYRLGLRMRL